MLDRRVYPVKTKDILTRMMSRIANLQVCESMQEVGVFIDSVAPELSKAIASYYLAKISQGKNATLHGVFKTIHTIVYSQLVKSSPQLLLDQMEKAKMEIFAEIAQSYEQHYPGTQGPWDDCRLVQTSLYEFSINATTTNRKSATNADYTGASSKRKRAA